MGTVNDDTNAVPAQKFRVRATHLPKDGIYVIYEFVERQ